MTQKQLINIETFVIGTDPEAFLRNKKTGEIVSAIGLIPGSKHDPFDLSDKLGKGFNIQTDNVMVEWCVPPTNNPHDLHRNIKKCVEYTNSIIPYDLEVVIQPSAYLDEKYLDNEQARTFGCDPSFNAWTYQINPSPNNKTNLRTAGGHIHIGYDNPDNDVSIELIKALDLFLNIPSLILDQDNERKKMYGKAGEFRLKPYGVEFRGLSNYWINDINLIKFIFQGIKRAIEFVNNKSILNDEDQIRIQLAINNNDKKEAYDLINKFEIDQILEVYYNID